jgi:hypothetical protein
MKNKVIALSLLGLMLVATPAFAKSKDNDHEDRGLHLGMFEKLFGSNQNQFVVTGSVDSIVTNGFIVKVNGAAHVSNITNGKVTIKVDTNTKFVGTTNASSIDAASVGKNVLVMGNLTGSDLLATNVKILSAKDDENKNELKKQKAMGSVTAKTDTSITIKNAVTGDTKTITTDANTSVKINGETKALADVQVGDRGWVKFKTVGTTLIAKIVNLFR